MSPLASDDGRWHVKRVTESTMDRTFAIGMMSLKIPHGRLLEGLMPSASQCCFYASSSHDFIKHCQAFLTSDVVDDVVQYIRHCK